MNSSFDCYELLTFCEEALFTIQLIYSKNVE